MSCLVKVKCLAPTLPMDHTRPWAASALPTNGLWSPGRPGMSMALGFHTTLCGSIETPRLINRKRALFHNFWPSLAILQPLKVEKHALQQRIDPRSCMYTVKFNYNLFTGSYFIHYSCLFMRLFIVFYYRTAVKYS